jgi:uncharacterized protein YbdZ (MbtH family)
VGKEEDCSSSVEEVSRMRRALFLMSFIVENCVGWFYLVANDYERCLWRSCLTSVVNGGWRVTTKEENESVMNSCRF